MWSVCLGLGIMLQMSAWALLAFSFESNNWTAWESLLFSFPLTIGETAVIAYFLVLLTFVGHVLFNPKLSFAAKLFWLLLVLLIPIFGAFGYWKKIATGWDSFSQTPNLS